MRERKHYALATIAAEAGHFGLAGMRERMELVGGTLRLKSDARQTTTSKAWGAVALPEAPHRGVPKTEIKCPLVFGLETGVQGKRRERNATKTGIEADAL